MTNKKRKTNKWKDSSECSPLRDLKEAHDKILSKAKEIKEDD